MTLLSRWLVTVFTRTRNGQNVAGITGLDPFPLLPLDLSLIKCNCQERVARCVPLSFIGFLYDSYIIIINGFYSRCFPVIQICTHRTFKLFFHTWPHAQYFSKLVILVLRKEGSAKKIQKERWSSYHFLPRGRENVTNQAHLNRKKNV